MLIGSMNNPHNDLMKEVAWISKNFDFLDLTLEMPMAQPENVNVKELKALVKSKNLHVVGHTGWYLPVGSPIEELRVFSLIELQKCLSVFSRLGVSLVNVHFDNSMQSKKDDMTIKFNIWTLNHLVKMGKKFGINIMAENTPGLFSDPAVLQQIFHRVPGLLLHLDVGHANIGFARNRTKEILDILSKKLAHVHLSDNDGKGDHHLAIGKGSVEWKKVLGALKATGYDGTFTLEVFNPKARIESKKNLRKIWECI